MPVDLAMPLLLSNGDYHGKRRPGHVKPLRPSLHLDGSPTASQCCSKQLSQLDQVGTLKAKKKQVSFADHQGMALTRVKVFSEFEDPIDIPLNIQDLLHSAVSLSEKDTLVLDFAQPSSDYLLFRQRLECDYVCLEHCTLRERALAGTVKVKNVAFQKSVKLRMTYDTWKSHVDVPCQYMKDTYCSEDRDTFAFQVSLPSNTRLHERMEFAVLYEVDGIQYWDSNQGQNYRIVPSSLKRDQQKPRSPTQNRSNDWGIHFDRYGSPRCSHGIFPDWPGYASYEEVGPYY